MVAALTRIARLAGAPDLDATTVTDLLRTAATAADHIEHLRARAGPDAIDILAFIDVTGAQEAHNHLRTLVDRVIRNTPQLRAWRIV